jgi:crossover junction endodeoxyribonuclease RuvC
MAGAGNECVVLGLDPGSRCTGYGLVREVSGQASLLAAGTIRTDLTADMAVRLGQIYVGVAELIARYGPHVAAVENVFSAKNWASAIKLGQARGAALAACAVAKVEVAGYDTTAVKKNLVGVGRAEKSQVAFMVSRILNAKPDWSKDASDALALAICHLNMRRFAKLVSACDEKKTHL